MFVFFQFTVSSKKKYVNQCKIKGNDAWSVLQKWELTRIIYKIKIIFKTPWISLYLTINYPPKYVLSSYYLNYEEKKIVNKTFLLDIKEQY